jgi:hypothetical protein
MAARLLVPRVDPSGYEGRSAVPDDIVAEIRPRERNGVLPRGQLKTGDQVHIISRRALRPGPDSMPACIARAGSDLVETARCRSPGEISTERNRNDLMGMRSGTTKCILVRSPSTASQNKFGVSYLRIVNLCFYIFYKKDLRL